MGSPEIVSHVELHDIGSEAAPLVRPLHSTRDGIELSSQTLPGADAAAVEGNDPYLKQHSGLKPESTLRAQEMESKSLESCVVTDHVNLSSRHSRCPGAYVRRYMPKDLTKAWYSCQWWLLEISASLLSLATLAAIIAVVRMYDGRRITDLTLPHGLTLNGIIAVLASFNEAFLLAPVASVLMQEMWLYLETEARKESPQSRLSDFESFDAASRGPWGSMLLLLKLPGRKPASILAICVTILSLLSGTFIQQLVRIDTLVKTSNGSSSSPSNIPRSEWWTSFEGNPAEGAFYPPYDFIAAIYSSVLGGIRNPLVPTCPSGNCTWPLTPTLGVCGSCTNANYTRYCFDWCADGSNEDYSAATGNCTMYRQNVCNYTFPSGSTTTLYNFSGPSAGFVPGFQVVQENIPVSAVGLVRRQYLAIMTIIGAPYNTGSYGTLPSLPEVGEQCALWMCVKTYKTMMESGQATEAETSVYDQARLTEDLMYLDFLPTSEEDDPHSVTSFRAGTYAVSSLQSWFTSSMSGTVYLNLESQLFSNDLVRGIWNGTRDLDSWIQLIADGLTDRMRLINSTFRPEYNGTGYQLGVSVRWIWLVLPASLCLLSAALLVIVVIKTAGSPIPAWKGSPLTLLLIDVDQNIRMSAYEQMVDYREAGKIAGKARVRLTEQSARIWALKQE